MNKKVARALTFNLLTFDVEEWYQANYPGIDLPFEELEDKRLVGNIEQLLRLCRKYQAKATFFLLGSTAERQPHIVEAIRKEGHEIASHGLRHCLIYRLSPFVFEAELKKSLEIIEGLTGEKVIGFRAPSWSVRRNMPWFFCLLEKYGLVYDSSLFPAKTFLYGEEGIEAVPHKIGQLHEFPPAVMSLAGFKVPFSGGFYFRLWPYFLIKKGIETFNKKGLPVVVYLHPREIDVHSPRLHLPMRERFIHYIGLKNTLAKLERLLADFRFCSIKDYLQMGQLNPS